MLLFTIPKKVDYCYNRISLIQIILIIILTPKNIEAAPSILDGIKFAGEIGNVINDARNVRTSRDQNRYDSYDIESQPNNALFGNSGLLSTLEKVGECNPDSKGVCCLMPNYCVPVAECQGNKVSSNVFDLLKAVPTCTCPKGYKGDGRRQGSGCENINECATGEALCEDLCQDMSPGYSCGCRAGYRLSKDGYACEDINECAEGIAKCSQICTNSIGSHTCSCRTGYDLNSDGYSCVDIDECQLMNEIVEYKKGILSVDLSPKATATMKSLEICAYPLLCFNLPGAYTCHCPLGYKVNPSAPSICLDVDECSEGISADQANELVTIIDRPNTSIGVPVCKSTIEESSTILSQGCINQEGAFRCDCTSGFELVKKPEIYSTIPSVQAIEEYGREVAEQNSRFVGLTKTALSLECKDIDECIAEMNPCTGIQQQSPNNQTTSNEIISGALTPVCVNTIGSFLCECPKGYEHHPMSQNCTDIDECAQSQLNLCNEDSGEQCINTVGSYYCQCAPGYQTISSAVTSPGGLVPITCTDIDECLKKLDNCVYECQNTSGSYECRCPKGYTINPDNRHQCIDIDECSYSMCPNQTVCVNFPGSYLCGCPKGYESSTVLLPSQSRLLSKAEIHSQLSKESQRWLMGMSYQSEKIAGSKSYDELQSNLISWESPNEQITLHLTKVQSELIAMSKCQLIDVCSVFTDHAIDVCPHESKCTQNTNQPTFYCSCPSGSKLSISSSSLEPNYETVQRLISENVPSQERPTLTLLPGRFFGSIVETGLGVLSGGRVLTTVDFNIPELPWKRRMKSDIEKNYFISIEEILSPEELSMGMVAGLIKNPQTLLTLSLQLWFITHLDWSMYLSTINHDELSMLKCIDINECIEGYDGNRDLRRVCELSKPCCINLIKTGFNCQSKRGLLQRFCPTNSIDLSLYM